MQGFFSTFKFCLVISIFSTLGMLVSILAQPSRLEFLECFLNLNPVWMRTVNSDSITSRMTLQQMLKHENLLICDARSLEKFEKDSIPGAIPFPSQSKDQAYAEYAGIMNLDQPILVYGHDLLSEDSIEVSDYLKSLGFKRVLIYRCGFESWRRVNRSEMR